MYNRHFCKEPNGEEQQKQLIQNVPSLASLVNGLFFLFCLMCSLMQVEDSKEKWPKKIGTEDFPVICIRKAFCPQKIANGLS